MRLFQKFWKLEWGRILRCHSFGFGLKMYDEMREDGCTVDCRWVDGYMRVIKRYPYAMQNSPKGTLEQPNNAVVVV